MPTGKKEYSELAVSPLMTSPFPSRISTLLTRSVMLAPTESVHGVLSRRLRGVGPSFQAATLTKTPCFTAERVAISMGFLWKGGAGVMPMEMESTWTPSSMADGDAPAQRQLRRVVALLSFRRTL